MRFGLRIRGAGPRVLLIAVILVTSAAAQEGAQVAQLLDQCTRNIARAPQTGQRFCRDAIARAQMSAFPEEFARERRSAFLLLAESYYDGGRIEDAVSQVDSVEALGPTQAENDRIERLREDVDRLFRPLRITIRDRRIPLLCYIRGVNIDFVYPRRLTRPQVNRIEILRDATIGKEDEFQFVAFDESGQAYMEVAYFPVITFSGRSVGYSLIVEGRRRYRFNFSTNDSSAVEIFWDDEGDWELVERVPETMVKVELPVKYAFTVETNGMSQVVQGGGVQHVYLPAASDSELRLERSQDSTWERVYEFALYALVTITGGTALLGAR